MKKTDIPNKFPIPFAANAGGGYITRLIPTTSQIGVNLGRASLNDGFPPVTMQPIEAGGNPPYGQDENGILFMATSWSRWQNAGGAVYFDSDWAVNSGGYPKDAIIMSAIVPGNMWMSTVDDNTSNPDAFGAGWATPPSMAGPGDISFVAAANSLKPGWVPARNNYTIGAAGSSATFASAIAVFLYVSTWNRYSNAQCPVTGGRGPNALADFNALKPIQVFDMAGASPIGNDNGTGRLAGVPVIQGDANTTGSLIGESRHTLIGSESPSHTHNGTTGTESVTHTHTGGGTTGGMNANDPHTHTAGGIVGTVVSAEDGSRNNSPGGAQGITISAASVQHAHDYGFTTATQSAFHTHPFTTSSFGGDGSHNNVQRSAVVEWMHKL